jgi:hypothetical protein
MLVFRVAHPDDVDQFDGMPRGPYVGGRHLNDVQYRMLSAVMSELATGLAEGAHPVPNQDGIDGEIGVHEYFGFTTLEQLFAWFGRYIKELVFCGFKLYVYECGRVRVGGCQCAFDSRESTLVRIEELNGVLV